MLREEERWTTQPLNNEHLTMLWETQLLKAEFMLDFSRNKCSSNASSVWEATSHTYSMCIHNQIEKSNPLGHQTPESVERAEAIFYMIKFEEFR